MTDPIELDITDEGAEGGPPMTELQRIAQDSLRTSVLLCAAAGLVLAPGPDYVTVWVPHESRPSRYRSAKLIALPQIPVRPLGRQAARRPRPSPATKGTP